MLVSGDRREGLADLIKPYIRAALRTVRARARSRHYYEIFVITPGYASQVRKPVRMESTTLAGEINVEEIVEKL